MEKSIRTGFLKRASEYGLTTKQANDMFKSLGNMVGVPAIRNLTDGFLNNVSAGAEVGHADSMGLGGALGAAGGAIGGGALGALGGGLLGGFTGDKEDDLKTRLKRALSYGLVGGSAGALGGGLGGMAGGRQAGSEGYIQGTNNSLDAYSNALAKQYNLKQGSHGEEDEHNELTRKYLINMINNRAQDQSKARLHGRGMGAALGLGGGALSGGLGHLLKPLLTGEELGSPEDIAKGTAEFALPAAFGGYLAGGHLEDSGVRRGYHGGFKSFHDAKNDKNKND